MERLDPFSFESFMELYFDIRKKEGQWHRIYHRARVGPSITCFEFDHKNAEFTLRPKSREESVFSYADIRVLRPSKIEVYIGSFLRIFLPSLDTDRVYTIELPDAPRSIQLHFPLRKRAQVEEWVETFEQRRESLLRIQDFNALQAEKASGNHVLRMPEGGASNAGTPVAIPLSLHSKKRDSE